MKKIFVLVITFLMIFSFAGELTYAIVDEISPYYLHIRSMAHSFDIDTQTGETTLIGDITIKSGASCSVNATIKRQINGAWRNVIMFNDSGIDDATISESPYLSQGYKYKCVFTFTVYNSSGDIIEEKTFESQEVDYR